MAGAVDAPSFAETLTQTQTQATQPSTQPAQATFAPHLWGTLVSCEPHLPNVELLNGKTVFHIGRHPSSDIKLNGKKISSHHACIWQDFEDPSVVRIRDTSTNGTFVNFERLTRDQVTIIESGDTIIFGPPTEVSQDSFRYLFSGKSPREKKMASGGIYDKYEIREQLGKGNFATVRKGVEKSTGKIVAIKIIQKSRFAKLAHTLTMIRREVEIMKGLNHDYCVRYYDYFEDDMHMWLVIEYVEGGDLLDYVVKRNGLGEAQVRDIAIMICQAVSYLHSKGITHRDIKPENLLMTKGPNPICKVTDFGLAKVVDNQTMLKTLCGTPTYLAPEVVLNEYAKAGFGYNNAVDAWSIGVVIYSCLANATPFDEDENESLVDRMMHRRPDLKYLKSKHVSSLCIDFLSRLLMINPAKRMTLDEALKHPWLAEPSSEASEVETKNILISEADTATTVPTSEDPSLFSNQLNKLRLNSSTGMSEHELKSAFSSNSSCIGDSQQLDKDGEVTIKKLSNPFDLVTSDSGSLRVDFDALSPKDENLIHFKSPTSKRVQDSHSSEELERQASKHPRFT